MGTLNYWMNLTSEEEVVVRKVTLLKLAQTTTDKFLASEVEELLHSSHGMDQSEVHELEDRIMDLESEIEGIERSIKTLQDENNDLWRRLNAYESNA